MLIIAFLKLAIREVNPQANQFGNENVNQFYITASPVIGTLYTLCLYSGAQAFNYDHLHVSKRIDHQVLMHNINTTNII